MCFTFIGLSQAQSSFEYLRKLNDSALFKEGNRLIEIGAGWINNYNEGKQKTQLDSFKVEVNNWLTIYKEEVNTRNSDFLSISYQLHYYLCDADLLGNRDRYTSPEVLENIATQAREKGFEALEQVTNSYISWFYHARKQYAKSLTIDLKNLKRLQAINSKEPRKHTYEIYSIAHNFFSYQDYNKTIEICKSIHFDKRNDTLNKVFTIDLLGMAYYHSHQYELANSCFGELIQLCGGVDSRLSVWTGIAKGNLGLVAYKQNQLKIAEPLLEEGKRITAELGAFDNTILFATTLVQIFVSQKRFEKANSYLAEINGMRKPIWPNANLAYFETSALLARMQGNYAQCLAMTDSAAFIQKHLDTTYNNNEKVKVELQQLASETQVKEELLESKVTVQKNLRNFMIGVLLLLFAIAYLLFKRRNLQIKSEKQKLELLNKLAEQNLLAAKHQLSDFKQSMVQKNKMIEEFTEQIQQLQSLPCNIITPEQSAAIAAIKANAILTEDDWIVFRKSFDSVHKGFLDRLQLSLPSLTPSEVRFIALSKLNFNNKEMAGMLGVSAEAMRTAKSRLKKKMNITEDDELVNLINSI